MIFFSRTLVLALVFGSSSIANATPYLFNDNALPAMVSELDEASFTRSIAYAGLDGVIFSAILTIYLSDDASSNFGALYVDTPIEKVQLSSVTGNLGSVLPALIAEIDGNSITESGITADNSGAQVKPFGSGTPTSAPGTIGSYFNFDVTALLGGASGSLSFVLDALNTRDNFPDIANVPGGIYLEDFNYEGAELVIVTSVPVPTAVCLLASGLIGLLGFSRKTVN